MGARGKDMSQVWNRAFTGLTGLYFANPHAKYFTVGRLAEDQIANYAKRKGQSIEQIERWLTPNLSYEPARTETPSNALSTTL